MSVDLTVPRSIARLQYAAARLPLTLLDEWVIARYWDQDALVRASFERGLGSLDLVAGWLLSDDAISCRGLALMRFSGDPIPADGHVIEVPERPAGPAQVPPVFQTDDRVPGASPGTVSRAVLQALAEQVNGDRFELFDRLASQLPGDLQTALLAAEATDPPLQLDAFYQRVSELARVPPEQAEDHTRMVIATLQEEISGTPLTELFARLPPQYSSLLPEQPPSR